MKTLILALLVVCFKIQLASGQELENEDKPGFILSPVVSYQGQLFGEISLMYAKVDHSHSGSAIWGPRIGMEANLNNNRFIYAPKIGYELSGMLIALRGSAVGYIDESRLDLRILPEAGVSLNGAINLTYGYSLPVLNFKSSEVSRHRVTLTANIHRELWHHTL